MPYRLQPTSSILSTPEMVHTATTAAVSTSMISILTTRSFGMPPLSENECLNVYQPESATHCGLWPTPPSPFGFAPVQGAVRLAGDHEAQAAVIRVPSADVEPVVAPVVGMAVAVGDGPVDGRHVVEARSVLGRVRGLTLRRLIEREVSVISPVGVGMRVGVRRVEIDVGLRRVVAVPRVLVQVAPVRVRARRMGLG